MRPSLFTVCLFALFGLCFADPVEERAPATTKCVYINNNSHPGYTCGTQGSVKRPAVLTSYAAGAPQVNSTDSCRAACQNQAKSCLSFSIDAGNSCTLYSESIHSMGGIARSRNGIYNYNLQACFKKCCYTVPAPAYVKNGGFEEPYCNFDDNAHQEYWSFGDPKSFFAYPFNIDEGFTSEPGYKTHSGSYFVYIEPSTVNPTKYPSFFSQTLTTIGGGEYQLTYYYLVIQQDSACTLVTDLSGTIVDTVNISAQSQPDANYRQGLAAVYITSDTPPDPVLRFTYSCENYQNPKKNNGVNNDIMLMDDISIVSPF